MVLGDVKEYPDLRVEGVGRLQMKTAQLENAEVGPAAGGRIFYRRRAYVAPDEDLFSGVLQNPAQKGRRGRLAVRARNGEHRAVDEAERKLHLAYDSRPVRARLHKKRGAGRHPRAHYHQIQPGGIHCFAAGLYLNADGGEFPGAGELIRREGVRGRNEGAASVQKERGGDPCAPKPHHERLFAGERLPRLAGVTVTNHLFSLHLRTPAHPVTLS